MENGWDGLEWKLENSEFSAERRKSMVWFREWVGSAWREGQKCQKFRRKNAQ
jgi:hypothetical protein